MLTASAVNAAPRGGGGHGGHHGGHGAHFSSISPRGGHHGGHGAHFRSISPRGRHTFSRSGSKFRRGTSATYGNWSGRNRSARNWSGRNWSGRNWSGRNWSGGNWSGEWSSGGYWGGGSRFIFIGGGYPYYSNWYPSWGWGYPYLYGTTAIILIRIILRIGTLTTVAPYQDRDSLGPDPAWSPGPASPGNCASGIPAVKSHYASLNLPVCSCVSIALPA